ncbi:right-handed parallel beta-helix repeat-containing protein [Runella sp.]|uniref:right-handed parallel beta-helix repeat-containing protein n=1 Tax=Runella sp. TaxID=1960881 RepID=UPI003D0F59A7
MKNLFTLLVMSLLTVPSFAARYHVKTTGSDVAAGTNWTAAFATLQKALATATSGDEIWVAAGTYYPDEGGAFSNNDRNAHFTMKNGVAIYGGFPATGNPTMTDRNWVNNPTILSGEIQQDNDISNNTYNIIYNFFNNLDATSLLDGFTVSGGYAYGIDYRTLHGGGVHNRNTAPAFQNCTFSGNRSIAFGGGMFNEESSPTLVNCSFQANEALQDGGGICNFNVPHFTLTNCSFSGNKARTGGGVYVYSPIVSTFILTNCSFSGNKAETGGALDNDRFSSLTLTNCIVWGNSTPQIRNSGGASVYTHCLIEGLNPAGTGNLDGTQPANNPLFVSQPDFNAAPTTTGNLRLQPCSPAINAGTNGTFTNADKDLDGNARLVNTAVDLGAYEAPATVFHVKPTGSDANDGLSWNTAFRTLQKALQSTCSGTSIWVAAGTYYPDEGGAFSNNDRYAYFTMKNGVAIYGGFPALGNPVITDRDWVNHPTILSGEIQQDNDISNNTYNIIYNFFNNLDATSLLDGFTVSGGYADGSEYRTKIGGGVHNRNTAPAFQNCTFSNNQSLFYGGGMYNEESSPTLINCSFSENQAFRGGGMYTTNNSSLTLTNCSFSGNKAEAGEGGGVYSRIVSSFTLTNCSFSGNKARFGGGIFTSVTPSLTLINCSFSANQANAGGVLYNDAFSSLTLTNCILWGNSNPQINHSGGTPVYSHCLIEGLNPAGTGNLDGTQSDNNPLFVSQPDLNAAPTTTGNLRLQLCSPAINAGTNGTFTNADKDLDRNSRIAFTTIDLGAYESQSAPTAAITPTISSTNPSTCGGSNGSITLSGFSPNTTYAVTYTKGVTNVPAADFTADANGDITLTGQSAGVYTHIEATYGACVSNAATATLNDPVKPLLTLSTIPAICVGATSFSIPYTNPTQSPNTYSISGTGITGVTNGGLTNPINVTLNMGASGSSIPFTLTVKNSTTNCESAPIMGSVAVTANTAGAASSSPTLCINTRLTNITHITTGATGIGTPTNLPAGVSAAWAANTITISGTPTASGTFNYSIPLTGGCGTVNATGSITVKSLPTAVISGGGTACAGATLPNVSIVMTGIAPWSVTYSNGSTPTTVNNIMTSPYVITGAAAGTYSVTSVSDVNCTGTSMTGTATVTVNPAGVGGTVDNAQTICANTSPADLSLNGQTGDVVKWQKSTDLAFTSPTDIEVTTTTLTGATIGNLTANTYFRAVVKSGVCAEVFSSAVLITVLSPVAPVTQPDTLVTSDVPFTLRATGCTGSDLATRWFTSSDNSPVLMPATLAANGSFYARCEQTAAATVCLSPYSNNVNVTVIKRIFVNAANNNPTQNGASWATAFSQLTAGLTAAALASAVPVEVWVAKGTYKPGTLRRDVFTLPSGVKVYGGFEATETLLNQRNPKNNLTILSGEIATPAHNDNTHHVVVFNAANDQTRLDGFRIEKGYAEFFADNQNTNLTVAQALTSGGGILALNKSKGTVTNCIISDNKATFGGGIFLGDSSQLIISQTVIWANEATFGGGLYIHDGSRPRLENVSIVSNKGLGGGLYVNASQPTLIHCTIASNLGTNGTAGGIFNTNAATTLKNAILWGNSMPQSTNGSSIFYSIVEGGFVGTGNLNQNPRFVSASPAGLAPLTALGDYHLLPCSPAIDAAHNADGLPQDLDGNPRPFPSAAGIVDMGAYESSGSAGSGPATLTVTEPITSGTVLKTAGQITAANQVSGATVVYQGSQSVMLLPGFSAGGNTFQALISDCQTSAVTGSQTQK